ncbi:TPA: hypothetical protein PXM78_002663 [Yersinia enterocolitica]|jgi:hypothetical protein|nr:hypothetical protein [Yersinia enterocolitica]HDL6908988.1 hypothetical protein [Yersinia enterocolitica]HDL7027366.1 hypothetical protein [Yersinia enterocolitica]HDL7036116.1 hypothetical protein [Yersinia enterocolitica]HDL7200813.1 hypothetical protein [Yersinia enterocolitica]
MIKFTDKDILKLDERFAREDIPFHARPFHAATEILGEQFSIGFFDNPQVSEIQRAYARLIPEVEFTWPGMGTGLAASMDRVRKVIIGVTYGTVNITVDKGLGFSSHQEWATWCRSDPKIAGRSAFAFADMHDLVSGIDHNTQHKNVSTLWGLAAEQLKLVAESLSQSGSISSPVLQPICLTAELAMKGTLLHLGIPEKDLKNPKIFGHNLLKLGQKMTQEINHRDDSLLLNALSKFPDYVGDRYRETKLTRLQVITLALDAQFVAASSVRRISEEDLALQMETTGLGPRGSFFS